MPDNKTIIITGCTKGIGYAICAFFAGEGFDIAGCARDAAAIGLMQQQFETNYPSQRFLFRQADVSNKKEVQQFAAECMQQFARIDILVNNAGTFIPGNIKDEADGVLGRLLATNLESAYHFTRALLPAFIAQKNGHIFNMCSVASIRPYPNGGSYCISKFALLGFSRQLREELKTDGVRVTAVLPGATLTDSWKGTDLPPERLINAADIAQTVFNISCLGKGTDVEEIIIRPQLGDLP